MDLLQEIIKQEGLNEKQAEVFINMYDVTKHPTRATLVGHARNVKKGSSGDYVDSSYESAFKEQEMDPASYTERSKKDSGTVLKEGWEETVDSVKNGAEEAVTPYNAQEAEKAKNTVKGLAPVYDHGEQATKNDKMVEAGNQESEETVNTEKEEAVVNPTEFTGDQTLQRFIKQKDLSGQNYLIQNKDGSFQMSKPLTPEQFYAALGDDAKKSIKTKNILTAISAGLGLLGMPAPNLGKMYENFTGKNYKELYEEYLTQDSLLREGINEAFVNAYDIYLTGASTRGDLVNEVTDTDHTIAEEIDFRKDFSRRLEELQKTGKINENLSVSLQAKMNDLEKEQQEFIYELQSKLDVAKHQELWELISNFTPDQLRQFSYKLKVADPNNTLTAEDLGREALGFVKDIAGKVSDKKTKSFISGAKLFGKRR